MDIGDLKLNLQKHFTDGLVTVVGSGLSCAEGLPGMGELAAHLEASIGLGLAPLDLEKWEAIKPKLSAVGLEAALLAVPPTPGLEAAIIANTAGLIELRERKIIADIFANQRVLRFTRLVKQLLKPPSSLPIITTNYDRLLEVAIEEAGLGVDTLFVGQFAGQLNESESRLSFCREVQIRNKLIQYRYRPRAVVLKPHGSLDWYHRQGRPVRYSGVLDHPRLIITPGLNKFRNGYDSPFDRHRERANLAIDRASRFLAIGYGFNDDHLETHLTPRIRSGVPTVLLTHTISSNAMELVKSCPHLMAIQSNNAGGSIVFASGSEIVIPDLNLWDLGSFVTEVLEP